MDVLVTEGFLRKNQAWADAQPVRWGVVDPVGALALSGPSDHRAFSPAAAWLSQDLWFDPSCGAFLNRLAVAPTLRWVQTSTAGSDAAAIRQLLARGVWVSTSHGQAEGIADYVLAGVLDAFQDGPARRRAQAERRWAVLPFREIAGSQWLILGYGHIGRAVTSRALAFGAEVTALRRASSATGPVASAPISALRDWLPRSDVVVLCLPATPATDGLIDAAAIAVMKAGSILVNIARGSLVDEAALLDGLERGAPGRAILDVTAQEPLPTGSALWNHPSVALTGHTAWACEGAARRNDAAFRANLQRILRGERPGDLVFAEATA